MIPKNQLLALLGKLREKTDAGEVNWEPHDDHEYGCRLTLDRLTVELIYQSPPADPDRVRVKFNEFDPSDGFEIPVAEMTAEDGDREWETVHGLYLSATKKAYHWDRVVGELEAAVNSAGRIGLAYDPGKAVASPASR